MEVKNSFRSGIGWTGAGNLIGQLCQLVATLLIARYLSPDDFGLFSVVMVFVAFLQIAGNLGTVHAVIRMEEPDQLKLSSIFWVNVVSGIVLTIILLIGSFAIGWFFGKPLLIEAIQLVSLNFILMAFTLVQRALLEKKMQFDRIFWVETGAWLAAAFSGVILAIEGYGVFSLVWMTLIRVFSQSLLLWIFSDWRPHWLFSFEVLRDVKSFVLNLFGFEIINYFSRNADNFLVGKLLGTHDLGIYGMAYKIMLYPLENISRVIVRVVFPVFARNLSDTDGLKVSYLASIRLIAFITFPAMLGLMSVADNLVALFFPADWSELSLLLKILSPVGLLQSIVTTTGALFMAKGETSSMFRIGIVNAFVTVSSFLAGIPWGVSGVAICYAAANLVMLFPNLYYSWRLINLTLTDGARNLGVMFVSSLLMYGTIVLIDPYLLDLELMVRFFIEIVLGVFVYTMMFALMVRDWPIAWMNYQLMQGKGG